jgi:sugar/nucleoside kinase (ribokinase family)
VDTYGAGDVFMAALTLELARGTGRDEALALAARAAAAQLTRRGGEPS